jgi:uncharacterized cupin superfamily protein
MPKLDLSTAPVRDGSFYPPPFDEPCRRRAFQRLADAGGLTQFGVNLVRLPPGAWSSQRHWHAREDELVYLLEGELVLVTDAGEAIMRPGDVATFKAGHRDGHHLQNRSGADALFLAVGTRDDADWAEYSDIDLVSPPGRYSGSGGYTRKDGTPAGPRPPG